MPILKQIPFYFAGPITLLFCLLLVVLFPGTVRADNIRQANCQRCHTVLPDGHASVTDNGLACLQCHAGHSTGRSVVKSQDKMVPRSESVLQNGSAIDGVGFMVLLVGMLGPLIHGLLFLAFSPLRKSSRSSTIIDKSISPPGMLRGWHVINALTVVFLSGTGFGLRLGMENGVSINVVRISMWHAIAGGWHVLTWLLWLGFNLISKGYVSRYLLPVNGWWRGITRQIAYYCWGIFVGRPHPHPYQGFNPLQSAVYLLVIGLLLPAVMFSGVGLLSLQSPLFADIGTWKNLLMEIHFLAGCLLLAFLSVHLYLAVWGPEGRLWRR